MGSALSIAIIYNKYKMYNKKNITKKTNLNSSTYKSTSLIENDDKIF